MSERESESDIVANIFQLITNVKLRIVTLCYANIDSGITHDKQLSRRKKRKCDVGDMTWEGDVRFVMLGL